MTMHPFPDGFLRAASFDWEALLPILFFVLYGLSQFFGGRKGEEAEEGGEEPDVDAKERARQIREDIRRKIEARRKGAGQGAEPERGHAESRASGGYDPTVPEGQQSRQRPPAQALERKELSHNRKELSQPERKAARDPRESEREEWNSPVPGPRPGEIGTDGPSLLERKLAEQRKRLEESRRQQEAAHRKARSIRKKAGVEEGSIGSGLEARPRSAYTIETWKPSALRAAVLSGLRDPKTIRQAVLYREILDPPVGMR